MSRPRTAALIVLQVLGGCHRSKAHDLPAVEVLERIPSSEVSMTTNLGADARAGTTLEITLRNVGQRTLVFDTGLRGYPMADFAFSFELRNHQWVQLYCQLCTPASSFEATPYTIRLGPSQFMRFTVPLSTLVGSDPHTGNNIDLHALHGRMLVELHVPTPPDAKKAWLGYVNASIPMP